MSPSVPTGPEAASTSGLEVSASSTPTLQSSVPSLSPAGIASIVIFLSFLALGVIGVAFCLIRRWRRALEVRDASPKLEKGATHDVEALTTNRLIIPVAPSSEVRWVPQIRSISGPVSDTDFNKKSMILGGERARSPSPDGLWQSHHLHLGYYPRSAPPYTASFSQTEPLLSGKSSGEFSPPVSPQVLASGMETRSLGRLGQYPKDMHDDL